MPHANSTTSSPRCTSPSASASTLPCSAVIAAELVAAPVSSSRNANSTCVRRASDECRHCRRPRRPPRRPRRRRPPTRRPPAASPGRSPGRTRRRGARRAGPPLALRSSASHVYDTCWDCGWWRSVMPRLRSLRRLGRRGGVRRSRSPGRTWSRARSHRLRRPPWWSARASDHAVTLMPGPAQRLGRERQRPVVHHPQLGELGRRRPEQVEHDAGAEAGAPTPSPVKPAA